MAAAKAKRCTENVAGVLGSHSECGRPMPCPAHMTIANLRARLAKAERERDQWEFRASLRSDTAPMFAEKLDHIYTELRKLVEKREAFQHLTDQHVAGECPREGFGASSCDCGVYAMGLSFMNDIYELLPATGDTPRGKNVCKNCDTSWIMHDQMGCIKYEETT